MQTGSPRPRLWFGAQSADTNSDWLKQPTHFTAGASFLSETKNFEIILFQIVLVSFRCAVGLARLG